MDEHELLDRYLDSLAGGTEPDQTELDPELAATVRRLRDLGRQARPNSSFVDTLEESMMHYPTLTVASTSGARLPLRSASQTLPVPTVAVSSGHRLARHWMTAALVATILILLGGVGLNRYLTDEGGYGQRPTGASIQAPGTPTVAASLEAMLVDLVLPAEAVPPAGKASIYLTHDVMPAETTATWKAADNTCCPGVKVYVVLSGTVRVSSDGPAEVLPGGDSESMREIEAGQETLLEPGDAIVLRNEFGNSWTSNADPVQILAGAIFTGYSPTPINPTAWEYGPSVWKENAVDLPGGPYRMRLERRELNPGEEIPLSAPEVHQFGIGDSGGLGQTSDGTLSHPFATEPVEIYLLVIETIPSANASPTAG